MTDRIRTVLVHLEQDTRVDDVCSITAAISMVKGVSAVQTGPAQDAAAHTARHAVSCDMLNVLQQVLMEARRGDKRWQEIKALLDSPR